MTRRTDWVKQVREDEEMILLDIEKNKEEFEKLREEEDKILSEIEKKREEFERQEKENKVDFILLKIDLFCSRCDNKIKETEYNKLNFIYGQDISNVPGNEIFCSDCLTTPFWKTGTLDKNCSTGIGYITEVLVAKFLGIKTCFDIEGKFNHLAFDMYEHEDWLRINAKGATLRGNGWSFSTRKNKVTDFFFCIGYDRYRKHVKSVHIIPNADYISKMGSLYISIDNTDYEWFREDEKPWDELFHTMKLADCPILI